MEDKWLFRNKFIKISTMVMALVVVLSMSAMMIYAENKTVIETEDESGETSKNEEVKAPETAKWKVSIADVSGNESTYDNVVKINCPVLANAENVKFSVRYDLKTLKVFIYGMNQNAFLTNAVTADSRYISEATGEYEAGKVTFSFSLKEACECSCAYEGTEVVLSLSPLDVENKTVVVIDAGHGGSSFGTKVGDLYEKNVTLEIARKVCEMSAGKNYKVMLTRDSDDYLSTEERINICRILETDFFISVHTDSNIDDTKLFGMSASYNNIYRHRKFGNADFADAVLRNVCLECKNKALGLVTLNDDEVILNVLDIPSTYLYVGYLSNTAEAKLLKDSEYIEMIARGIINALDEIIKQ